MAKRPSVAIVGLGNLGTALAFSLNQAGYSITEVVSRHIASPVRNIPRKLGARILPISGSPISADLVWICVPDGQIRACAQALVSAGPWRGKRVFHSSGALGSDQLQALRRLGAAVASVHPMMTFVRGAPPSLAGVAFALEGDSPALKVARQIVRDLGGEPFLIARRDKTAYHAFGAFASPLLVAALVTAEQVAHSAGIQGKAARQKMLPIVRQTIDNYANFGAAGAFSGPIIRGDAETVRKHLQALSKLPEAKQVYRALVRSALRNLPSRDARSIRKILA